MKPYRDLIRTCLLCTKAPIVPTVEDMRKCWACGIYRAINEGCVYCGSPRDLKPYMRQTARGPGEGFACQRCIAKHT